VILSFFPKSSRSGSQRRELARRINPETDVSSSYREFGFDYFDNPEHVIGYGGYEYDGRFAAAAKRMVDHYGLKPGDRILEIGCAKGTFLIEFRKLEMEVEGVDVSRYAVEHALPEMRPFIRRGEAKSLPFPDGSFDLVIGKEVLPHVPMADIEATIQECMRVSRGKLFFEIQCGRTKAELDFMQRWDATHKIMRTPLWWEDLFESLGYHGDVHYKILIPEADEEMAG